MRRNIIVYEQASARINNDKNWTKKDVKEGHAPAEERWRERGEQRERKQEYVSSRHVP